MSAGPDRSALVECVANVSEGQRSEVIARIAHAVREVAGAYLLDLHSDAAHNRSVYTVAGPASAVAEAGFALTKAAIREIDMRQHRGVHPRIGAVDVLPFVPLVGADMELCVELAHEVGHRIGDELETPVYFYGEAALRPERRRLVDVRRGEYEGLADLIGSDPARTPDAGPASLSAAGAVAVGARRPLIAFNVHLRTDDLGVARAVARAVRASNGGLPGVQALGLGTARPGIAQVSMNLVDLEATPLHVVVARMRTEAARYDVELAESELVGLTPAGAVLAAAAAALGLSALGPLQVLELALAEAQAATSPQR
ncbi:MAG: glutamate formiminotransferase / formiminotetrahydrofolate cyclodeaminase [Chloroflexota bacterium]|jgi:glutamate formiminotransferase|nr:glutamate formiminotransferase / formiminotetrahydrofolate cyclodeaminase [Chloroflexota bacterium]